MKAKGGFTKGPSHQDGGIPMTVKSTGQKIEVEGGEAIINKKSMADDRKFKVEGTPREIASAINEIDGNGVSFDKGAKITIFKKGGIMYEPTICNRYSKNSNQYDFYVSGAGDNKKIGQIKLKPNYYNTELLNIDNIKIDDEFSNSHTYKYYIQAVIDASNKKGAVMSVECLNDECMGQMLDIGEINDNCDKLTIR
jgi:hypothetical protein|tara:strand:+ start:3286 stop:3873 length:588 start_codon:yes stop_codon:yes gene_type:complete